MSLGVTRDGGQGIGGIMRPISERIANIGERTGIHDTVDADRRFDDFTDRYDSGITHTRDTVKTKTRELTGLPSIRLIVGGIAALAVIYVLGQLFNINLGGA